MKYLSLVLIFLISLEAQSEDKAIANPASESASSFLGLFPHFKDYLYQEPPSGFFLGLGLSPVGTINDRILLSANFFQAHYIKDYWDINLLSASYGITRAQTQALQSTHFTLRAAPKLRFFGVFSIGPLFGYEFVSFPNLSSKLFKAPFITPNWEPFSSRGWIYGVELSQTFKYGKDYLIKISQVVYQGTYSAKETAEGWRYIYENAAIQADPDQVNAGTVFFIEASFLY